MKDFGIVCALLPDGTLEPRGPIESFKGAEDRLFSEHHTHAEYSVYRLTAAGVSEQAAAEKARDAAVERATQAERTRCVNIALRQYAYWRDAEFPEKPEVVLSEEAMLTGIQIGATGAASNIVGEILGLMQMGEVVGDAG